MGAGTPHTTSHSLIHMDHIAPPFYQSALPFNGADYEYWVSHTGRIDVMVPFKEPPGLSFRSCFVPEAQKHLATLQSEHTIAFDLPQDVLELVRHCADLAPQINPMPHEVDEVDFMSSAAEFQLNELLAALFMTEINPYIENPSPAQAA